MISVVPIPAQPADFSAKHLPVETKMNAFTELQIIGQVSKVQAVGSTLRVSLAPEHGRRDHRSDLQH